MASDRRILVQGSMRSDVIVIVGVGFPDPTQMHLAQDNDVVHTLTPDRSDQPLGIAILPRRTTDVEAPPSQLQAATST